MQNNTQLGFFFFKKEDAEAIIQKVWYISLERLVGMVSKHHLCNESQSV